MAELPTGTVSLVFSDIERSTALLARLGPAYAEALDAQRHLLRDAWTIHEGAELGTEGDSFFVAFATAGDAVAAAVQAQRALAGFAWPAGERVRVRMGVHTGTPTLHDGGYVGMDVHRAARIAAVAHGGQVVLSEATARLLPPDTVDVTLRDLGLHQLKDLDAPEHLFQLDIAGLETEFDAVRSLGAVSNIPLPATPLVGRDGELSELAHVLGTPGVRLVTLTGPGGSGKTRLAVAVARELVAAFPDGVYFVPLAAVTMADEMWTAIGEVLGVPPEGRIPPGFFTHVAYRSALFVLDNLEQLPTADAVVSQLLAEAPQVVVIATSRRPLHVAGEHEHPVPTLELPTGPGLDECERSGAVQMFVQHAIMVRPSFTLSEQNAADVAEVCRRLDGLPLAIELAAARSKLLSPRALLARLDQALELGDAGVDRPVRQQTLRATIAWSHDLLDADHQRLFRHLGVFGGGADLDAVAAVTGPSAGDVDALELVAGLVDASLAVVTEGLDGEPRIGLLETIRSYALDCLEETGELPDVRVSHAQHYLGVAHELHPMANGSAEEVLRGYRTLELELDNFREALSWAFRPGGADRESGLGLALCAPLSRLWTRAGYYTEAARWLELALDRAGDEDSPELATCLHAFAWLSQGTGKRDRDYELLTRSVAMFRRLGDKEGLSLALSRLAAQLQSMGDLAAGREALEEAVALARESGARHQLANALAIHSNLEAVVPDPERSLELIRAAVDIGAETNDESSLLIYREILGCALREIGRLQEAWQVMWEVIPGTLRLAEPNSLMILGEDLGAVVADLGHSARAAQLLGAVDAMRVRHSRPRAPVQEAEIAAPYDRARVALSPAAWDWAYERGRGMTVEDVLTEVRREDAGLVAEGP